MLHTLLPDTRARATAATRVADRLHTGVEVEFVAAFEASPPPRELMQGLELAPNLLREHARGFVKAGFSTPHGQLFGDHAPVGEVGLVTI